MDMKNNINPRVKITLEDNREITIELFKNQAPLTVDNFLKLVEAKYYDGVCFHRIIENFMIQTGGYYVSENSIHEKEKTNPIFGEFQTNGFKNDIKHELGVISMARLGNDNNSASSQFFICSANTPHLDGSYCAFGKTVNQESNDVILALSKAKTVVVDHSLQNFPYPVITIKSIEKMN